ncbi:MAG: hypothetical protein ACLFWF_05610, partial [Alphaproteobacteria bacterium]
PILSALAGSAAAQSTVPPTVQAQPPSTNVPVTRSATVRVTWVITNPNPDPILSVNSPGAQLFFSGPDGSGNLPVTQPLTHGQIPPNGTARIAETIVVPQSFLMQALQAGTRNIDGERFFEIEVTPGQFVTIEGNLQINLTGGLGSELQISRIDLRFQNEAVQIIVPQNHPPEVRADIGYTGTGVLRAVWELADPRATATGGNPIFRTLRQERVRLGVGGRTSVKGPSLPADLTGLHIVRFRVLDGPLRDEAAIVRYFVKAAGPDSEDWWKRYIRPHREGEGLVRVPAEPDEDEQSVETPPEDEAAPEGEEAPEDAASGDESGGGEDAGGESGG